MNKRQTATLNMWHAVQVALRQFTETVKSNPGFLQRVQKFKSIHEQLHNHAQAQLYTSRGVTMNKDEVRTQAEKLGFVIAANIRSWALANGNHEIAENMYFQKSTLKRMKDAVVLETFELIAGKATTLAGNIAELGTSAEKLDEYRDIVDNYGRMLGYSRNSINNKSNATQNLAAIVRQGRTLLKDMDKVIYNLEEKDPDFLRVYFKARELVSTGGKDHPDGPEQPPSEPSA